MKTNIHRRQFIGTALAAPFVLGAFPWSASAAAPALKVAGFADEISPKLDEQIRVLKELGVGYFELRAADGKGVLDFTPAQRKEILAKLKDNGLGVASIGSPVGKTKITEPWPAAFDKLKVAVEAAEFFGAPLIRVFSYFPDDKQPFPAHRDEVMKRLAAQAEYVKNHAVTLVHENEKRIYGEKGPACLDLLKTINSPKLRCAFDFANFVQAGDDPLENWKLLKPYVVHFHIKDCQKDTKKVVPAGQGDGHVQAILEDAVKSGYNGFLSLEPHLKVAGESSGETGPELFKVAASALRDLCKKSGIALQ